MADIPAANVTNKIDNVCGSLKEWYATVEGDGSGVTLPVPFGRIVAVFFGNGCLTGSTVETVAMGVTWTNGPPAVLTYAAAPSNGKKHVVRVIGY